MRPPVLPSRVLLEELIGSGGFATVWLGWDPELESQVAVKILAENWAHRADVRQRFIDEGRLLRRVNSPRVVSVYDIGELDDGRPFLVMEYLDGGTLAEARGDGPLPPAQARRLLREIGEGLQVLHAAGIVHRDLNPNNVLLSEHGAVLADLGLAKDLAAGSGLTQPVGTGRYRAPEQFNYSPDIGPAADVFAFAVVAEELFWPQDLSRSALKVLAAAQSPTPARRPTLPEVLAALEPPRRKTLRLVAALVAVLTALGIGGAGYWWANRPQQIWDGQHRVSVRVPADWKASALAASATGGGVSTTSPDGSSRLSISWRDGGTLDAESHPGCGQLAQSVTLTAESGTPYTGRSVAWVCPNNVSYQAISLADKGDQHRLLIEKTSAGPPESPDVALAAVTVR